MADIPHKERRTSGMLCVLGTPRRAIASHCPRSSLHTKRTSSPKHNRFVRGLRKRSAGDLAGRGRDEPPSQGEVQLGFCFSQVLSSTFQRFDLSQSRPRSGHAPFRPLQGFVGFPPARATRCRRGFIVARCLVVGFAARLPSDRSGPQVRRKLRIFGRGDLSIRWAQESRVWDGRRD
jgi:hypothetical protein